MTGDRAIIAVDEETGEIIDLQETPSGRPVYFYLGASYITIFNLYGEDNPLEQFKPGAAVNLGIVSSGLSFFNVGLELSAAWYDNTTQILFLESSLLFRKHFFSRKAALTFRAGAGMIMPLSQDEDSLIYLNTGLSFLFRPLKLMYIEAGVNYSHLFLVHSFSGDLRPWAGIGIMLN